MKNYLENEFKQTSKAILFEKFAETDVAGEQLPNLRRYLTEEDNSSDSFYKKVISNLGVRSFEEFLDKFTPWLYEVPVSDGEDGVEIKYYLRKPESYEELGLDPIALNSTAIYEMVEKLYDQRKNSGQPQIDFKYDDISNLLSPESQTKKILQIRGDMEAYFQDYYRLEEKMPGVNTPEKENCINMFNQNRVLLPESYGKGPGVFMQMQLADATNALLGMKEEPGGGSGTTVECRIGIPYYDENGELRVRTLEAKEEESIKKDNLISQNLYKLLETDYQEKAPDYMKDNEEVTNLVLSTVTTSLARKRLNEGDSEYWLQTVEKRQKDYKRWMENLANVVSPLIEKFIGVKAFFDNATGEAEKLDSILIVANSTVSELLEVKGSLKKFLQHINDNKSEKIWFGIMPAVSLGNETIEVRDSDTGTKAKDENDPLGVFGSIDEAAERKEKKVEGLVNANDAKILLDICREAKIITFYNYKANKNTNFGNITKDTFEAMKNCIFFDDGSYAVCCLPNFTVIPEEETNVIINKQLRESGKQDTYVAVKIPAIYIEASYVAVGMMVGAQQKTLLERKGLCIDWTLTNVRVNLEEKKVYKKFQSNMCIENLLPVPRDMDDEIMQSRFGFYFSDKEITGEKGKKIKHCYVKNARTMEYEGKEYKEISHQMFEDFILDLIGQGEVDSEDIKSFLNEDVEKWDEYKQTAEQDLKKESVVNALLKHGENISTSDNQTIKIDYGPVQAFVKPKIESIKQGGN